MKSQNQQSIQCNESEENCISLCKKAKRMLSNINQLHTCREASSTKRLTALAKTSLQLLTCCPPRDNPVSSYAERN